MVDGVVDKVFLNKFVRWAHFINQKLRVGLVMRRPWASLGRLVEQFRFHEFLVI